LACAYARPLFGVRIEKLQNFSCAHHI
jgi:hypothetical protein